MGLNDFLAGRKNLLFALFLSTTICFLFLTSRIIISHSIIYGFLVWNLFLAWIPFVAALLLEYFHNTRKFTLVRWLLFLSWLFFFPNAPYIITDLIHIRKWPGIPLWFDTLLVMAFIWHSLLLGFISLKIIHNLMEKIFSKWLTWVIVFSSLLLCSFGIYLGRFLRWNTWDIISNPLLLLIDISERVFNPHLHPGAVLVTLFFTLFLSAAYILFNTLLKHKNFEINSE